MGTMAMRKSIAAPEKRSLEAYFTVQHGMFTHHSYGDSKTVLNPSGRVRENGDCWETRLEEKRCPVWF